MTKTFITSSLVLLAFCPTFCQVRSESALSSGKQRAPMSNRNSTLSNENLVDALVASQNLYVEYVEDGAADGTVLALYPDVNGIPTNTIAKEVKDIVALHNKAIPLLIAHLDDNRPTSAVTYGGGYLTDKHIRVPVGFICLDILINIIGVNNKLVFSEEENGGFGSEVNDGYYFRPDDYRVLGDHFIERPIVRIVKANWQKAYGAGKIKYDYVVTWK